jgi:membrane protein involved in colicin uptake
MSNYKQLSVMAFILAISAQAYAAEDLTSATSVTDQQPTAAVTADTNTDTGAVSNTAKNTDVRKKRMDHFSVEFYDDVELANTAADYLEEDMITISTTRYVDKGNDAGKVIEIAALKEKKNEVSAANADDVSAGEDHPAEIKSEQVSQAPAESAESGSHEPIILETVDTADALRKKTDASSVIADAEKDLDAASNVISNKEKITTIDVTKSVQDPARNVSSKIMQKADENVREIEKKQAESERARLADEDQKRLADEAIEAEARAKLEELEAKAKAEEEAKLKAEADAKAKAEEEAKLKAEAEAKAKAEEEAKAKAEEEAKAKAEEEAKLKAEAEAKAKAEEEAKAKAEEEAKLKAEAEAKAKAEEEAKLKAEAEAKAKAEEEAKLKAEAEAKAKAEEEAKAKAEEEAKLKAEAEAKAKAEEEAKLKAEAEAKAKAEEEAKLKAEADAKVKAEEEVKPREITEAELYSEELDKLFPLPPKDAASEKTVDMNAFNGVLKVKPGMGLEQIGSNLANKVFGVSKYQAAVAVYRRNPRMFSNKAPVYPFSGMLLKVPTKEQMALESDSTYFDVLMRGQGVISAASLPKLQTEKTSKSYDEQLKKVLEQRKNYLLNK